MLNGLRRKVNSFFNVDKQRSEWIQTTLQTLPRGKILDAGSGSQPYRSFCSHLDYVSQDFDSYQGPLDSSVKPRKRFLRKNSETLQTEFQYGKTDIVSQIERIPVSDGTFDFVLCTDVLEHVLDPKQVLVELTRVLGNSGELILTVPMNSIRHFEPFYYTSGLSDHWIRETLDELAVDILEIKAMGDYYSWMRNELFRSISQNKANPLAWVTLLPALMFYASRRGDEFSRKALCSGWLVRAKKRA